jgi:tyrosyl-tRNA synthetase
MEGAEFNKAKELLAFELTKMVHGEEEANKALNAAKSVFGGGGASDDMPTTEVPADKLTDGKIGVLDLLMLAGLVPSKREGRTIIAGGGLLINDVKIDDPNAQISLDEPVIIRKGKKVFHKAKKA